MNNKLAWSLLDPRPVMVYDLDHDADLCFWNGQVMTRTYALIIVSRVWCNLHVVETVKQTAWQQLARYYSMGVFSGYDLGEYFDEKDHTNYPAYLSGLIQSGDVNFFTKLVQQYTAKQALAWFCDPVVVTIQQERQQNVAEF